VQNREIEWMEKGGDKEVKKMKEEKYGGEQEGRKKEANNR